MAVRLLASASFVLVTLLAGCSDGGEVGAEVAIHNFVFDPASITVADGESVRFVNHDTARHTATADGGAFELDLAGGEEGTVKVDPGTYQYHCKLHASMRGTLVVS